MKIDQEAVFIGANKQSFSVDYSSTERLVAYGAGKTVALWNPLNSHNKGVYTTLKDHSAEVTCVRFIPESEFLVTCGEDFKVDVWKKKGDTYLLAQSLEEHTASVTCIAVLNSKIFVTGGSDGQVIIWGYDNDQWHKVDNFSVKPGFFPLSLALEEIKSGEYVLTIGGTSPQLFVYTFEYTQLKLTNLKQAAVLTGHEDWIKSLAFIKEEEDDFLLASGSQDRYIRLWRLRLNGKIDDSDEDSSKLILLSNKQYKFKVNETRCAISFEALIMGHDDWVTGLAWHPSSSHSKLQLLSSSADTALMVWEMDHDSGIWVCASRLGELSIKGASTATGASGGFWSCVWFLNPETNDQYIITNGKTGSIRMYKSSDEEHKNWDSVLGVTGPIRDVTDIVWSINGDYFMATSLDQTTRLLAPWHHGNSPTWHEFARPQIHGYDMICIDNLSPTRFVSAGDEKILRVFEMTHSIKKLLTSTTGAKIETDEVLPDTASLPVLGLSNKAANDQAEVGEASKDEDSEVKATDDVLEELTSPPLEDYLQRFTLFPELEKLYGHGYEITCCVTSPNGKLIATSCRTNSVKHGMIRLFNIANDFQQCQQTLPGHTLTVTNIVFSPNGKYLLTVGRDRQSILWEVINEDTAEFKLIDTNPKAHTRIIWDSGWVPQEFGDYYVTVGRDKQIKLWGVVDSKVELIESLKIEEVITAISIYKQPINNKALLAIGLESGNIKLLTIDFNNEVKLTVIQEFASELTPSDRITSLKFSKSDVLRLAVGSADSSIRLYNVAY